ncbi:MAG: hypothetical protein HYU78_05815 [Rhodocyclales bacterium]|nr:hypothetical protein [Rhodocyclales bacterium]
MKLRALLLILLTPFGWAADPSPLPDDPTRPPAGIADADGASAAASNGLMAVMLPRKGKPAAVIDGQLVPLGGTVRGARLVKITENFVVLEGEQGREQLYLTPDIEKKAIMRKTAPRRQKE